jgi:hypothetical protein
VVKAPPSEGGGGKPKRQRQRLRRNLDYIEDMVEDFENEGFEKQGELLSMTKKFIWTIEWRNWSNDEGVGRHLTSGLPARPL